MKPLMIDLFAGLGGWAEGGLAECYDVIGFDIEQHVYGDHCYPAQLILQDVLTLHGRQFKDVDLIVASPPCQEFSWMAMPWKRAKQVARALRGEDEFPEGYRGSRTVAELTALFDACFRIQREASEAAGRHIPMVVENVRGAIPWVGRSRWNFGSYQLWGDVPALMPMTKQAAKVPGLDWSKFGQHNYGYKDGEVGGCFRDSAIKNAGGSWFNIAHNTTSGTGRNPDGRAPMWKRGFQATAADRLDDGRKHQGSGAVWFDTGRASLPSASPRRKAASALIAKIPLELSRHIARIFLPQ